MSTKKKKRVTKRKRSFKKKSPSKKFDMKITDIDDLADGGFYHVMNNQKVWDIRQYSPASKGFTRYGTPIVGVTEALINGVVKIRPEPFALREDVVYLRDVDGTGSMHVCTACDAGAAAYIKL